MNMVETNNNNFNPLNRITGAQIIEAPQQFVDDWVKGVDFIVQLGFHYV